ncbi:MAG: hypothetical protein WB777_16295, partial [Mycobacterium sp.]
DSIGNRAGSPCQLRGKEIMNARTRRTVVATAALAAAGLFGSLPWDGSSVAQSGVPVQHHDVALVDLTDATVLSDEGTLDAALVSEVSTAENALYTDLDTSYGASVANSLLDTTTGGVGDFNGAETAGFNGVYLDGLAAEDELNPLVGISQAASQAALLNDLTTQDPTAVTGADLTALTNAVGSSTFDTDLMSYANADYSLAVTDFEGYLASLSGDPSSLGDVSTLLADLSSSFTDSTAGLSTELSTILSSLF